MKRLILIDGHSLLYRAFYALPPLSTKDGFPTNATYGFIRMLIKLIKQYKPTHCGIAFDTPKPTFRHLEFKEYKIKRPEMPDKLKPQVKLTKDIINAMGIKTIEFEGYEADDIIGTISAKAESEGFETYIVSADKDSLQLVSNKTKLLRTVKGISSVELYDYKRVIEEYGIEPEKIPHLIALKGDQSDNIPGIPSIGPQKALELLRKYGDINNIILNSNLRSIKENEESLKTYLCLATIKRDLPISFDIEELKISEPDKNKLFNILRTFEFQTIINELNLQSEHITNIKTNIACIIVQTISELKNALKELTDAKEIYLKVITSEHLPMWASIEGICLSTPQKAFLFLTKNISLFEILSYLHHILCSNIPKIGCDLKRSLVTLKREGFNINKINFDLAIASYLLDPNKGSHTLENIALSYLGESPPPEAEQIKRTIKEAEICFQLKEQFLKELRDQELYDLFEKVELPMIEVLASMEVEGIKIDKITLYNLELEIEKELKRIENDIFSSINLKFNLNSPKQLSEVLFNYLKLTPPRKKKTSTDAQTLLELMRMGNPYNDVIEKILVYRQLSKFKSTYISNLPKLIHPRTNCIHTTFNQTVTATGRLSSSDPNLQNIPIRTPVGKAIRKAFKVKDKENIFISADYSQIELRILAHFSKDPALIEAFEKDLDIHTKTAAEIFGIPEKQVTEEERRIAKVINFGIIYGMSPHGLAQELKISQVEAQAYIDKYFSKYTKVKEFIENIIKEAREKGYVKTLLGRKRKIEDLNSKYKKLREQSERYAINTPVQGSAADIIKLAMIELHRKLRYFKIVLQIHDELLFEGPENKLEDEIEIIKDTMTKVINLSVPLKVSLKKGKDWGEMEKIT
ncbi:MAG: DNA polymerase I [Synergistetes bacterium]|nr:DNA polymerase I [Synergistota bacterium]